jgi:hypothetical protein
VWHGGRDLPPSSNIVWHGGRDLPPSRSAAGYWCRAAPPCRHAPRRQGLNVVGYIGRSLPPWARRQMYISRKF